MIWKAVWSSKWGVVTTIPLEPVVASAALLEAAAAVVASPSCGVAVEEATGVGALRFLRPCSVKNRAVLAAKTGRCSTWLLKASSDSAGGNDMAAAKCCEGRNWRLRRCDPVGITKTTCTCLRAGRGRYAWVLDLGFRV